MGCPLNHSDVRDLSLIVGYFTRVRVCFSFNNSAFALWLTMTVGIVFEETILWLDVLYIVKRPLSIVCLPLSDIEYRKCTLPFTDPVGLGIPARSNLYPPDLFGPKSFCLFAQMAELKIGPPIRCIFMQKKGALMNANSWFCEYGPEFKTLLTPVKELKTPKQAPKKAGHRPPEGACSNPSPIDVESVCESDASEELGACSDDEKADDLSFWFDIDDEWDARAQPHNPVAQNVDRSRLPIQEINVLQGLLAPLVDETKYYFAVNSLTSIVTVRWKHSERGLNWEKFTRSKKTIDSLGMKKFHSSSSSSLSIHSYDECVTRAKRWCSWHSCWVYDTRPMTLIHMQSIRISIRFTRMQYYFRSGFQDVFV